MKKLSKSKTGISFLEILVAVAILSVSLVLIIQSLYLGLTSIRIDGEYFKASLLADNILSGVLTGKAADLSSKEDQAKPPFENYRYNMEVTDSSLDSGADMKKVNVLVSWPSGVKERKTAVSLYLPSNTEISATEEN